MCPEPGAARGVTGRGLGAGWSGCARSPAVRVMIRWRTACGDTWSGVAAVAFEIELGVEILIMNSRPLRRL